MENKFYPIIDFPHQAVIIYKGVFHFKYLYMAVYDWVCENGWRSYEGDDKVESMYAEEHQPGPVRKVWIWWRMQKNPDNSSDNSSDNSPDKGSYKGSYKGYFRYFLNIEFLGFGVTNVEIVKDGKKIQCQKGELDILIKPWIEADYGDKWKKSALLKNFIKIYQERIIKNDIEKRLGLQLAETNRLHGMIKKTLDLAGFSEDREIYSPKYFLDG